MCIYKGNKRIRWYSGTYIDELIDEHLDQAIQLIQDRPSLSNNQQTMIQELVQERDKRKARRHAERYGLRGTISTL